MTILNRQIRSDFNEDSRITLEAVREFSFRSKDLKERKIEIGQTIELPRREAKELFKRMGGNPPFKVVV